MPASDYRNIIGKALGQYIGKVKTIEELRDKIVDRMEIFDEVRGDALLMAPQVPVQQGQIGSSLILTGSSTAAYNPSLNSIVQDVTSRIGAPVASKPAIDPNGNMKPAERKEILRKWLDGAMPPSLPIKVGNEELQMNRRLENAPGDMEFVRVSYCIPGTDTAPFTAGGLVQPGNQGATIQVNTDAAKLDADELIAEVMKQATSIYGSAKKVIPVSAPPRIGSLYESLAGTIEDKSPINNAGDAGAGDMSKWGASSAAEAARGWSTRYGKG
jgi:hypothetical protein